MCTEKCVVGAEDDEFLVTGTRYLVPHLVPHSVPGTVSHGHENKYKAMRQAMLHSGTGTR